MYKSMLEYSVSKEFNTALDEWYFYDKVTLSYKAKLMCGHICNEYIDLKNKLNGNSIVGCIDCVYFFSEYDQLCKLVGEDRKYTGDRKRCEGCCRRLIYKCDYNVKFCKPCRSKCAKTDPLYRCLYYKHCSKCGEKNVLKESLALTCEGCSMKEFIESKQRMITERRCLDCGVSLLGRPENHYRCYKCWTVDVKTFGGY